MLPEISEFLAQLGPSIGKLSPWRSKVQSTHHLVLSESAFRTSSLEAESHNRAIRGMDVETDNSH